MYLFLQHVVLVEQTRQTLGTDMEGQSLLFIINISFARPSFLDIREAPVVRFGSPRMCLCPEWTKKSLDLQFI